MKSKDPESSTIYSQTTNYLASPRIWLSGDGLGKAVYGVNKEIQWAHHSLACANHKEQYQKLLARWYFTSLRIAKAYSSASPYCRKSCGSVGSLLHIFWSCTLLGPFWDSIFSLISSITRCQCPRTPEFALLLIGVEDIPLIYRVETCNILHAAHLTIARHWKLL